MFIKAKKALLLIKYFLFPLKFSISGWVCWLFVTLVSGVSVLFKVSLQTSAGSKSDESEPTWRLKRSRNQPLMTGINGLSGWFGLDFWNFYHLLVSSIVSAKTGKTWPVSSAEKRWNHPAWCGFRVELLSTVNEGRCWSLIYLTFTSPLTSGAAASYTSVSRSHPANAAVCPQC